MNSNLSNTIQKTNMYDDFYGITQYITNLFPGNSEYALKNKINMQILGELANEDLITVYINGKGIFIKILDELAIPKLGLSPSK